MGYRWFVFTTLYTKSAKNDCTSLLLYAFVTSPYDKLNAIQSNNKLAPDYHTTHNAKTEVNMGNRNGQVRETY